MVERPWNNCVICNSNLHFEPNAEEEQFDAWCCKLRYYYDEWNEPCIAKYFGNMISVIWWQYSGNIYLRGKRIFELDNRFCHQVYDIPYSVSYDELDKMIKMIAVFG
jgi:hypothetical protein